MNPSDASTPTAPDSSDPETNSEEEEISRRFWTIPNILCVIRLVGSLFLPLVAWGEFRVAFLCLFLFLSATDWIDGKLAIWLNQRSVFGARLDSWADFTLYLTTLIGTLIMMHAELWMEAWWIAGGIISYTIATLAGLAKFGKWPSYHTRLAKICWLLIAVGIGGLILDWSVWPLRTALIGVMLTNVESLLITARLKEWRADVSSVLTLGPAAKENP